jgi:hypothetical protein
MKHLVLALLLGLASQALAETDPDAGAAATDLAADAGAEPDAGQPDAGLAVDPDAGPLDVREPPFATGDYTWMNGNNYQPQPLLVTGPVTWTLLLDVYYGFDFNRPEDHTVFPATTAPRHNEFNLNYAVLGVEATGVTDVLGKLTLQMGNYIDTITGTDLTANRGAYSGLSNLRYVQRAYVGYHLHVLHGLNLLVGIFPSYVGLESYVPQENWDYTHNFVSDFTPYYLTGAALQLFPRDDLKTELWIVNGWQSLSKYGEQPGVGWAIVWRPTDRVIVTQNMLSGRFDADQARLRFFADNSVQWQYARQPTRWLKSLAIDLIVDVGYETAGASLPATTVLGGALLHRVELSTTWAIGVRASVFRDPQRLLALALPAGAPLPPGDLLVGEATATVDFKPTTWLLYRLEYRHDAASLPYIAGPGGVTRPASAPASWAPDLRTSSDRIVANATLRF